MVPIQLSVLGSLACRLLVKVLIRVARVKEFSVPVPVECLYHKLYGKTTKLPSGGGIQGKTLQTGKMFRSLSLVWFQTVTRRLVTERERWFVFNPAERECWFVLKTTRPQPGNRPAVRPPRQATLPFSSSAGSLLMMMLITTFAGD